MLPRRFRLSKSKDIKQVFRLGRTFRFGDVRIKILPRHEKGFSRFAVVVSTAISKKATDRNKIKRRIRHALVEFLPSIQPGYDVIISPYPTIIKKEYGEIQESVKILLYRAKICQNIPKPF